MRFGKLLIICACLVNSASADDAYLRLWNDSVTVAYNDVHKSFSELNKAAEECSVDTAINAEKVKPLLPKLDKEKIIFGLTYFNLTAYNSCVREHEANVLFALAALKELIDEGNENKELRGKVPQPVMDYLDGLPILISNASKEYYRVKTKYYLQLTDKEREQLESIPELKAGKYELMKSAKTLGLVSAE
ncbi:hypothetical protein [Zooshikella ganghwensis]|uniref:Uncharacterized protein n=1 Tax=Zooshikella ganghwensis TaxID=202772 RepID=A0A4P9VWD4_9GAMM|nr:hypothetical protein [Zooshikella ganghwensis]RDH46210.1 hypothetical protein B9G39_23685 [Zooshikella ganghwensis]